jgi:hypothetical protein
MATNQFEKYESDSAKREILTRPMVLLPAFESVAAEPLSNH